MGIVLVDIGGGTTDIAIWKNSGLIHSQIIPVGGEHFTNDLAHALKIPCNEAERIKVSHGSVLKESSNHDVCVQVQGISGTNPKEVPLDFIVEVLEARAVELFEIIGSIIVEKSPDHEFSGGIVLTGGGALVRGMPVLGEYIIERPTKIGYPFSFGGMSNTMQNPKFATVLGLLLESRRKALETGGTMALSSSGRIHTFGRRLGGSLKTAWKEIF